jgi:hypothetical protein
MPGSVSLTPVEGRARLCDRLPLWDFSGGSSDEVPLKRLIDGAGTAVLEMRTCILTNSPDVGANGGVDS